MASDAKMNNNIRVVVRIRPPAQRELKKYRNIVDIHDDHRRLNLKELVPDPGDPSGRAFLATTVHSFSFDHVHSENDQQEDVYATTGSIATKALLQGFNATILAYGQTGTGKTHTMEGFNYHQTSNRRGILPRCMDEIFDHIFEYSGPTRFQVRASYLQIYNEQLSDLLANFGNEEETGRDSFMNKRRGRSTDGRAGEEERGPALVIKSDKKRGPIIENLSEWLVSNPTEIYSLLARGGKDRVFATTASNDISSRSHTVFTITVEQISGPSSQPPGANNKNSTIANGTIKTQAKLSLVDLAGSERVHWTGARGQQLEESKKINTSLLALGNVTAKLVEPNTGGTKHIPYRDSKLTRILEDSLGGNCVTTIAAMISPAYEAFHESLSTLKFATRTKNIVNMPIKGVSEFRNSSTTNAPGPSDDTQQKLIQKLHRENQELRQQLVNVASGGLTLNLGSHSPFSACSFPSTTSNLQTNYITNGGHGIGSGHGIPSGSVSVGTNGVKDFDSNQITQQLLAECQDKNAYIEILQSKLKECGLEIPDSDGMSGGLTSVSAMSVNSTANAFAGIANSMGTQANSMVGAQAGGQSIRRGRLSGINPGGFVNSNFVTTAGGGSTNSQNPNLQGAQVQGGQSQQGVANDMDGPMDPSDTQTSAVPTNVQNVNTPSNSAQGGMSTSFMQNGNDTMQNSNGTIQKSTGTMQNGIPHTNIQNPMHQANVNVHPDDPVHQELSNLRNSNYLLQKDQQNLQRYKQLLLKQRVIMRTFADKVQEKDQSIFTLQEQLNEAQERYLRMKQEHLQNGSDGTGRHKAVSSSAMPERNPESESGLAPEHVNAIAEQFKRLVQIHENSTNGTGRQGNDENSKKEFRMTAQSIQTILEGYKASPEDSEVRLGLSIGNQSLGVTLPQSTVNNDGPPADSMMSSKRSTNSRPTSGRPTSGTRRSYSEGLISGRTKQRLEAISNRAELDGSIEYIYRASEASTYGPVTSHGSVPNHGQKVEQQLGIHFEQQHGMEHCQPGTQNQQHPGMQNQQNHGMQNMQQGTYPPGMHQFQDPSQREHNQHLGMQGMQHPQQFHQQQHPEQQFSKDPVEMHRMFQNQNAMLQEEMMRRDDVQFGAHSTHNHSMGHNASLNQSYQNQSLSYPNNSQLINSQVMNRGIQGGFARNITPHRKSLTRELSLDQFNAATFDRMQYKSMIKNGLNTMSVPVEKGRSKSLPISNHQRSTRGMALGGRR